MLVRDTANLIKTYVSVHEKTETDDNDFNIEDVLGYAQTHSSDVLDYYKGNNPNIELTPQLKKELYRIDIGNVTPGSLSQQGLLKAFKTIRQYVPAPWQYRIQYDINSPITVKIGRNTIIKNFPAYTFDFDVAQNAGILPQVYVNMLRQLSNNFKLTPEKVYIFLKKIPRNRDLEYGVPVNRDTVSWGTDYAFLFVGKSQTGQTFGAMFYKQVSSAILYGPKKSVPLRSLTIAGGLLPFLELSGANRRQWISVDKKLTSGQIKSIRDIPITAIQTQFKSYLENLFNSTGLNE